MEGSDHRKLKKTTGMYCVAQKKEHISVSEQAQTLCWDIKGSKRACIRRGAGRNHRRVKM
jgi:hypothetical protein